MSVSYCTLRHHIHAHCPYLHTTKLVRSWLTFQSPVVTTSSIHRNIIKCCTIPQCVFFASHTYHDKQDLHLRINNQLLLYSKQILFFVRYELKVLPTVIPRLASFISSSKIAPMAKARKTNTTSHYFQRYKI